MAVKRGKRAESHLEMIISFALFLMFLFFLFSYINPVKKPDLSSIMLDIAENGVKTNAQITLLEMPVSLKSISGNCVSIECPFNANSADSLKIFVTDENGNNLPFGFEGSEPNLTIQTSSKFIILYFSNTPFNKNLPAPDSSACSPPADGYTFSVPRLIKYYSDSTLASYVNDYAELKNKINFPSSNDFAVKIYNPTNPSEVYFDISTPKPEKGAVKAKDFPIEILKEYVEDDAAGHKAGDKEVIKATMNIQVW